MIGDAPTSLGTAGTASAMLAALAQAESVVPSASADAKLPAGDQGAFATLLAAVPGLGATSRGAAGQVTDPAAGPATPAQDLAGLIATAIPSQAAQPADTPLSTGRHGPRPAPHGKHAPTAHSQAAHLLADVTGHASTRQSEPTAEPAAEGATVPMPAQSAEQLAAVQTTPAPPAATVPAPGQLTPPAAWSAVAQAVPTASPAVPTKPEATKHEAADREVSPGHHSAPAVVPGTALGGAPAAPAVLPAQRAHREVSPGHHSAPAVVPGTALDGAPAAPAAPAAPSAPASARVAQSGTRIAEQLSPVITDLAKGLRKTGEATTRLVVRLHPQELGSVTVALRTTATGVEVTVRATAPDSATALLGQEQRIRDVLGSSGFDLSSFTVTSDTNDTNLNGGAGSQDRRQAATEHGQRDLGWTSTPGEQQQRRQPRQQPADDENYL